MLEMRPSCEHCDRDLPPDATDAMICSFECTFCSDCVTNVLSSVCPNCGGDFVQRPTRAAELLETFPVSPDRVTAPVDLIAHAETVARATSLDDR